METSKLDKYLNKTVIVTLDEGGTLAGKFEKTGKHQADISFQEEGYYFVEERDEDVILLLHPEWIQSISEKYVFEKANEKYLKDLIEERKESNSKLLTPREYKDGFKILAGRLIYIMKKDAYHWRTAEDVRNQMDSMLFDCLRDYMLLAVDFYLSCPESETIYGPRTKEPDGYELSSDEYYEIYHRKLDSYRTYGVGFMIQELAFVSDWKSQANSKIMDVLCVVDYFGINIKKFLLYCF